MGKKKKKHQTIYRAIKPVIKDDRIILSLLGAVGLGVTLASVTSIDEGRALLSKVVDAVKNLEEITGISKKSKVKVKPKKLKDKDPEEPIGE
ncbi:hypothetical protein [Adhaeribacter rhizoryzae]|uniref:Uncharacterized protein n=1 Tax=Adhaeribacter rhizoryzae TaxID=2607907 RepID=A0A5M6D176_9BACT|nr:hypothetical protein [Adhaeribacter rhizoryzae]KAA5541224.1 hypothetical protein F0145_21580 [Adhaeribacter rhizoryzae]